MTADLPECEHSFDEAETGPVDRAGRTRIFLVCTECGLEGAQIGWGSVL